MPCLTQLFFLCAFCEILLSFPSPCPSLSFVKLRGWFPTISISLFFITEKKMFLLWLLIHSSQNLCPKCSKLVWQQMFLTSIISSALGFWQYIKVTKSYLKVIFLKKNYCAMKISLEDLLIFFRLFFSFNFYIFNI